MILSLIGNAAKMSTRADVPHVPDRSVFTTTDAVIALQIAVGSRPPDPRWDVSGTSLDALMILQAAGGIEIG